MENIAVNTLMQIVRRQVAEYAVELLDQTYPAKLYYTENSDEQIYCVVAPYDQRLKKADLVLMARIVGDQVIIDIDMNDKPLSEALQQAGVPAEHITLAWMAAH